MSAITGERVSVPSGGFNPSYQRHVATYRLCAPLLPDGLVLDLGCGVGHSYRELAPRPTIGVDIEPKILAGQDRETRAADMRSLPFADGAFASVLSVQSIEHVPDPERALAEVVRVLRPGGRAVFATPNRLTFGRPDEIIDPYHYVEYDSRQLAALCGRHFAHVQVRGLHGSPRYMAIHDDERRELDRLLALDPLRVRRLVPRRARQRLYDRRLNNDRARPRPGAVEIEPSDFRLQSEDVDSSLDLVAICDRSDR
jgi:SAM-dependent methyltransferase